MTIVVGTQFYAAGADAMRRQANCAASLVALRGATPLNVQWRRDPYDYPGMATLATLERDSLAITGPGEPRRPLAPEVFDALAAAAADRGCRYFLFVNSDIIVTQAAVDAIERLGKQTYAISRMDVDGQTGREAGVLTSGIDAFALDVEWWRAERRRFRPYIVGSWFYDCVFAAIMMTFADGALLNRAGEIRHELHRHQPDDASPSAAYNGYLAALDAREFSLWARYHARLQALRHAGASEAEEVALAKSAFVWQPTVTSALAHVARCARARWRYTRTRLSARAAAAPR